MPKHDDPDAAPEKDFDPIVEVAAESLRGDVRDSLLGWIKALPKAWPYMSEKEQRDIADAADRFALVLVKQMAKTIASEERPCIVATLSEYREKSGVEAKLKLASTAEVIEALHEACGREVLIVTSGFEQFNSERAPAEVTPDQPGLGIGEEYNDQ